jgi:hypothetical protein
MNFIATQDVPVAFPKPKMSKVNQNFDFSQSIPLGTPHYATTGKGMEF